MRTLVMKLFPLALCWAQSPLCLLTSAALPVTSPDPRLSCSGPSVLPRPRQSPPDRSSLPQINLATPLQSKTTYPSVCLLCVSWLVKTYCTKCMMAVIVSSSLKKPYFYCEPIINPALNHLFLIFFCFDVSVSDHFLLNCKHAAPWAMHLMKPAFLQIYLSLVGFPGVQDDVSSSSFYCT